MDEPIASFHWKILALVAVAVVAVVVLQREQTRSTIPGPRGYPLVGIGWKLPSGASAQFRQWAEQYGEIFRLRIGWNEWVVLSSPEAIRGVLEKQAAHTSSKAPSPLSHDVVTGGMRMPTMPYGPRWRAQRAVVRGLTTAPMTASFVPCQEFEAKQLLFDLATANADDRAFYQHMRRFAFSIIMTNTFGTRIQHWDHPDAQDAVRSQALLRATSRPGAFLLDEVPPLARLLPRRLQPGRRRAEAAGAEVLGIKMRLWQRMERQVAAGTAPPCYARDILQDKATWEASGLTDVDLAWVAGGLVEAGFETSAATLNGLVLHLAAAPHVQARAHAEIDTAVGSTRLPRFTDLAELPYVRACVKEMLRLNPLLAPGIRHYADADVSYKGHVIRKGTVLLANTAFLHFDPSRFAHPFTFDPARYLGHPRASADYAASSTADPVGRDHYTFSTGRRTCPGARLAENSLNIALVHVLWAFEIRPPIRDGAEQPVDTSATAYPDATFAIPKPFAVRFVPRDSHRLKLLTHAWETASKEGYELRGIPVDIDGMVTY